MPPLFLSPGGARARLRRRARRIGIVLGASLLVLILGGAFGVYELLTAGGTSRSELFSDGSTGPLAHGQAALAVRLPEPAASARRAPPVHLETRKATATTVATATTTASAATTTASAATTAPSAKATPSAPAASGSLTAAQAALDAAAGSVSFRPPAYLMPYYERLAARYHIAWPVLAALSYVQSGGYGGVMAGADAAPVAAAARASAVGGAPALNVNVVSQAASAAAEPGPELFSSARKLAVAGGAQRPGSALLQVTGTYAAADAVLTIAQEIGALPAQGTASPAARIHAMLREAKLLSGLPYVWGGGHDTPAWLVQGGYDCSGFVSAVLHAAGYLASPQTTQTLPSAEAILRGPGRYVTLYDRTVNTTKFKKPKPASGSADLSIGQATHGVHITKGSRPVAIEMTPAAQRAIELAAIQKGNEKDNTINDEHVIIDIDGQWWESGGDTHDGGGASVHQITAVKPAYLKSFNLVLHPAGL